MISQWNFPWCFNAWRVVLPSRNNNDNKNSGEAKKRWIRKPWKFYHFVIDEFTIFPVKNGSRREFGDSAIGRKLEKIWNLRNFDISIATFVENFFVFKFMNCATNLMLSENITDFIQSRWKKIYDSVSHHHWNTLRRRRFHSESEFGGFTYLPLLAATPQDWPGKIVVSPLRESDFWKMLEIDEEAVPNWWEGK